MTKQLKNHSELKKEKHALYPKRVLWKIATCPGYTMYTLQKVKVETPFCKVADYIVIGFGPDISTFYG